MTSWPSHDVNQRRLIVTEYLPVVNTSLHPQIQNINAVAMRATGLGNLRVDDKCSSKFSNQLTKENIRHGRNFALVLGHGRHPR